MKYSFYITLTFFILIITSKPAYAQRGFKVIEKAEKEIKIKNYEKALKLLNKADQMDYGFCGNARLEADLKIDSLKFVAFYQTENYELARNSLDSIISFGQRKDLDSLKVITYQIEYGKEFLKENIVNSIYKAFVECNENDCYGNIPINNSKIIVRFKIYKDYLKYMFIDNKTERNDLWIAAFKKSEAYKLISNKTNKTNKTNKNKTQL